MGKGKGEKEMDGMEWEYSTVIVFIYFLFFSPLCFCDFELVCEL
jgi:hypothetical protein